jgi:hypothetical protein
MKPPHVGNEECSSLGFAVLWMGKIYNEEGRKVRKDESETFLISSFKNHLGEWSK